MLYWGKSVIVYMANITLMFDFSGVRGVCCDVGGEMLWRTVEDFSYPGIKAVLIAVYMTYMDSRPSVKHVLGVLE